MIYGAVFCINMAVSSEIVVFNVFNKLNIHENCARCLKFSPEETKQFHKNEIQMNRNHDSFILASRDLG